MVSELGRVGVLVVCLWYCLQEGIVHETRMAAAKKKRVEEKAVMRVRG